MTISPESAPRPPALIFGIPIADVTMAETLDRLGEMVADGRANGALHQIATVNVNFLANALEDAALAGVLRTADLCIADGLPIVWIAKALGMPITERVAGSDLVPLLFDRSRTIGWRIHVFGSSAEVARKAEQVVDALYPDAKVTFQPGPIITDVDDVDDEVLDTLAEVDADIVCVALGHPKQERFIRAHQERIGAPVMIGIGGSVDILVGERTRAPSWMQRIGMEWVARTIQEPRRLAPRYAYDIRVMTPRLVSEARAHRRRRGDGGIGLDLENGTIRVVLGGDRRPSRDEWSGAIGRLSDPSVLGGELVVDPGGASSISDASAALLVGLVQVARRYGRSVRWVDESSALMRSLRTLGVTPGTVVDHVTFGDRTSAQSDITA